MKRFRAYKIREMFAVIVFGSFVYRCSDYKHSDVRIQNCILRVLIYIGVFLAFVSKGRTREWENICM